MSLSAASPGQRIIVKNWPQHPEFNGRRAEIIGRDPSQVENIIVQLLNSEERLSINMGSIEVMPCPGQCIIVNGISKRPELNGQKADIAGPDGDKQDRVIVKVRGSGEQISVSVDKLVPVILDQAVPPPAEHVASCGSGPLVTDWLRKAFKDRKVQEATIVLLGQTGSGKTSLLNLLLNFPVVIQHGRDALDGHIRNFCDLKHENNVKDTTVSQTNAATIYTVQIGELTLKIVDTPGIGDTRGQDWDKKHAKMIVECIKKLGHVNAITLVISGRDSRMTAQLKYVLTEICAILPRDARHNIMVVFTNTSNPLYLSFDIDALSNLVEHTIPPDHQIFIENPFVLWERSAKNQGKVPESALRDGLCKAFQDADDNIFKLFHAISSMRRLNTKDFETIYNLRRDVESRTNDLLGQLSNTQKEKKRLEQTRQEIEDAKSVEKMTEKYESIHKDTRWVFEDAERHGTFCGVKDCYSNCHAPCIMEKTMNNERFKFCSAFRYTNTQVTLQSSADKDALLQKFDDVESKFHADQDGGTGCQYETILVAQRGFTFKGHAFQKDAMVSCKNQDVRSSVGWLASCHLHKMTRFPRSIQISDESEQDTCKKCGHHRKFHYHDEKIWVEEEFEQKTVDEDAKQRYHDAIDLRSKKEQALADIQQKIDQCTKTEQHLSTQLLKNIRMFEMYGLSRNYALLLQNQRDLLQQHIDATLEGEAGADVSALRTALAGVEKQLQAVHGAIRNGTNPVEWARIMLGVEKGASRGQIEEKFKTEARRMHPDKHGGNPERMLQLNEAVTILRNHLSNHSWFNFSFWS